VQGLSNSIQNMHRIEYLYKAVGRKRKQNLQVSIPKTSRILLVWVCVPAVKLDVAWVVQEVKSMNFHTRSACNVIMWKTIYEKPLQQNQLLLIIIYLQDVVPSKENGEKLMEQCFNTNHANPHFFEAKKVLFSKVIISRLFWQYTKVSS
jgi:hypothetical protein